MTPFQATQENVKRLHTMVHKWPLSTWRWYDDGLFLQTIMAPTTVIVNMDDDVGLVILERVRPDFDAVVSFVVWDGRLEDHFETMVESLRTLANVFQLEQFRAFLPLSNTAMATKLRRMGFQEERLRDILPDGELCVTFGLLYGELTNGRMATDAERPAIQVSEPFFDLRSSPADESGDDRSDYVESIGTPGLAREYASDGVRGMA